MEQSPRELTVAIHQPNFMPWMGYFYKMSRADIFIVMDNVQYTKGSWINRVQIKTPNGPLWITVPVRTKGSHLSAIGEIAICNDRHWSDTIFKTLQQNYRKSPHWDDHSAFLEDAFKRPWTRLIDLNLHMITYIKDYLGLPTKIVMLSSLGVSGEKSWLIARACRAVGGHAYLSGTQAADYNDEGIYVEHDVTLKYPDFSHPVYPQLHGEFLRGLSAVDLLVNCGPQSRTFFQMTER